MQDTVGEFLKRSRERRGKSVEQVAVAAGISPWTLRCWEQGTFQPKIPELAQVLRFLEASPLEQARAVALISGPRSREAFIQTITSSAPKAEPLHDWAPGAGDLWRALRRRRGWTARQLAEKAGLPASYITRYEQSEMAPTEESMSRLLGLLGASREESAFLSQRRLILLPPLEQHGLSCDEYQIILNDLDSQLNSADGTLSNLALLTVEATLWPQAVRQKNARRLLAQAYSLHAEWLLRGGQKPEMASYTGRAASLIQPDGQKPEPFWSNVIYQRAHYLAHGTGRPDHGSAIRYLEHWQSRITRPEMLSFICRDKAEYAMYLGHLDAASKWSLEACQLAEEAGDIAMHVLAKTAHARILAKTGRGREALALLAPPRPAEEYPVGAVWNRFHWAEILCATGDKQGTESFLRDFYDLITRFNYNHLREVGDIIARQLH